MTSFLVVGDPHFRVDNISESEHFKLQVQNWLVEHPVDYIVVLGDILHSHEKIFTFAMNMALDFINMCSTFAPTYCLVGNHDATSNTIYCSDNHWLHVLTTIPNVTVVDKPRWITGLTGQVLCCPYVSDGRFVESLNEFVGVDEWQQASLIFAHQLFNGAKMGSIVASNVEDWNKEYPKIISGHVHDQQQCQDNLVYVGNSNEEGSKGLVKVVLVEKNVQASRVYLTLKERKIVHMTLEEAKVFQFKEHVQYKLVLHGEDAAIKAFKKTAKFKEIERLEFVKAVQFKPKDAVQPNEPVQAVSKDFISLLVEKVQTQGDVFLSSYSQYMLGASTEDLSDKDVELSLEKL